MSKVKEWTLEQIDEAEEAFVVWFKKKYRREPNYRDVEKRWKFFEADRQMSRGAQ